MSITKILPGAGLVKELLVMGTSSALEEAVLKKKIDNLQSDDLSLLSDDLSLLNQLQEVKRVNQHFDSVLGQVQEVIDNGVELSEIYDVLLSAVEEVKRFRACHINYTRDLIKYALSLILYNR